MQPILAAFWKKIRKVKHMVNFKFKNERVVSSELRVASSECVRSEWLKVMHLKSYVLPLKSCILAPDSQLPTPHPKLTSDTKTAIHAQNHHPKGRFQKYNGQRAV